MNIYDWASIAFMGAAFLGVVSTAPGRRLLSRMFRGQSIQQIAQASADQIATVQAAYQVVVSENDRLRKEYEGKIVALKNENDDLRGRVTVLERLVTAKTEIDALTAQVLAQHSEVMTTVLAQHTEDMTQFGAVLRAVERGNID